jgi:hypothetical protein
MVNRVLILPLLCAGAVLLVQQSLWGQVRLLSNAGYTQTFDSLSGAGAAGTLAAWSDNTTIPGWYAYQTKKKPYGPPANYIIDDGSSGTGGDGLRSYGAPSQSDRALGELSNTSDTLIFSIALRLVNGTGATINALTVSCRGEQWRQNTGTKGLVCEYQVGASSISSGTWTAVPGLGFVPLTTGTAGPLDGNAAGNYRLMVGRIATGLAPGQEIWFRWTKQGVSSCGLAIDDISVQMTPTAQPTNLQFSNVGATSLTGSFQRASPAPSAYLVVRKTNSAPTAVPVDGLMYEAGDVLGDAIVAYRGSDTTFNQRGLPPATSHHFAVFSCNGTGSATQYLTNSPLTGNQRTLVAQSSLNSDIVAVESSEATAISSLINDPAPLSSSSGIQVWQFVIRDGGNTADGDLKPTILTGITLHQGANNGVARWSAAILAADLFDGSTHLASGAVNDTTIEFSACHAIVPDDAIRTITVRLSLKTTGVIDNHVFHFLVSWMSVVTEGDSTSSQLTSFPSISSDATKNRLEVVASQLRFSGQPSDVSVGTPIVPAVCVQATDANTNRDADYATGVTLTASGATLVGSPVLVTPTNGSSVFGSLAFSTAGSPVTLTAVSNGWSVTSGMFQVVSHRTFYVDSSTGNDALNGLTPATAWKSLALVNATVFQPGDSLLFKAGHSWTGQLKPQGSGNAANPIIVNRYGGPAMPVINGGGIAGQATVYLYNQEYWEINNLEIINDAGTSGDRRGVLVAAANAGVVDHIYLKNLFIHNIKGIVGNDDAAKRTAGIGFEVTGDASVATRFNDIWIDGCTLANIENTGLYTDNTATRNDYPNSAAWNNRKITNLRVTNNVLHHISKNAMIIRLAEGGLVEHNVCYETATGTTGNTMFTTSCDGTVFQYNEGYLNRANLQGGDFGDGSMYDADLRSVNCIFQYSYSHDNAHGLFWTCTVQEDSGNICRYNVSKNDRGIIFCINYPVNSLYIYNNTVYCGSQGLSPTFVSERNVNAGTRKYSFCNNIIYNLSPTAEPYDFRASGYTRFIDHNLYYGYHPSNEPADVNKLTGDPLFVDATSTSSPGWDANGGFALRANSPAVNTGLMMATQPSRDYWGNTVPNSGGGVDRGAFEFQPGTSTRENENVLPHRFALEQNYPNPFNPSTTIAYAMPAQAHVRLDVVDMLGRTVATLVNETQPAGLHSVLLQAAELGTGIYFYTLAAGNLRETKRLVLLR